MSREIVFYYRGEKVEKKDKEFCIFPKSKGVPIGNFESELPKTSVISLKGKKNIWGAQLENCPDDVIYIGRRFTMGGWNLKESPFCNPSAITKDLPREEAIEKYRVHITDKIEKNYSLKEALMSYKGKKLACWCFPKQCHGNILCEIIENM